MIDNGIEFLLFGYTFIGIFYIITSLIERIYKTIKAEIRGENAK